MLGTGAPPSHWQSATSECKDLLGQMSQEKRDQLDALCPADTSGGDGTPNGDSAPADSSPGGSTEGDSSAGGSTAEESTTPSDSGSGAAS